MACHKPPSEIIDAILLEMAVPHPHLSEAEEAALKSRLLAIVADANHLDCDAEQIARLFREATAQR